MVEPNSARQEDWLRFWLALCGVSPEVRHSNLILNYVGVVLHTGKNIIVEEARRWGVELRPSKRP